MYATERKEKKLLHYIQTVVYVLGNNLPSRWTSFAKDVKGKGKQHMLT